MQKKYTVTLIVSAGIAAYKALELTRLLRANGHRVVPIMTRNAKQFITPLSLEAIAEHQVYDALFAPDQESKIGHIQLARDSDVIVIAPASAHILAQISLGLADDLPTTMLLANTAPVLVAPAMNHRMWHADATQGHIQTLKTRGVHFVGPNSGDMACGEHGIGRMAEPHEIVDAVDSLLLSATQEPQDTIQSNLHGKYVVVTGGGTHESIDPVRYIANRSSGAQAIAIVAALARLGCSVTFVHGPMTVPEIAGVRNVPVVSAQEMHDAVLMQQNVDVFVAAAAVADWRVVESAQKLKKTEGESMTLELMENPDILKMVAMGADRPALVIGFAAETDNALHNAVAKLKRKGCDWLMLNEISMQNPAFGASENHLIKIFMRDGELHYEDWGHESKTALARRLASDIQVFF